MRPARTKYSAPAPPVTTVREITPGRVWLIPTMPSGEMLAAWSKTLPATSKIFTSGDHFTHQYGPYSETYILQYEINKTTGEATEILPRIEIAREAVQRLIGKRHKRYDNPGWTFSRLANTVTEWLQISQVSTQREQIIEGAKWNYQLAKPKIILPPKGVGRPYVAPYPYAFMNDIRGAYWQVWQRVKSPVYSLKADRSGIRWGALSVEEGRRWDRMHKILDDPALKRLHNAIVGTNVRGWRGKNAPPQYATQSTCYQGGKSVPMTANPGPLMPLSLLTVRTVYEIVQIQSEMSQSIYSNIDCVVTEFPGPMRYWDELGIVYRQKSDGVAIVRGPASRAIGNDYTEQFILDEQRNYYSWCDPAERGMRYETPWVHRHALGVK